ncbi:unnamed protein product [Lymnaea stagnalis]|uniref:G-protein coupled receptors family 1 profile domain-containing protein n=1 Tax=Lymnaea stagnalis TaxID=6523 RepID=A0AAV2H846_LYMST
MNVFILINHVMLSSLICLFGIVGNIINMCVFVKQGLARASNTSFFAMAVSDTLEIVFQLWHNVCLNPYLVLTDSSIAFNEIMYLTGGYPSLYFTRTTGCIVAYITAERCLSVTFPLRVKQAVTTGRTAAILVFIYVINFETIVPIYLWAYLSWKFFPQQNRTRLGISFRDDRLGTALENSYFQSCLAMISFVLVVVFTSVLVFTLKKNSRWRRKSTTQASRMATISSRERTTVIMVIVVAAVLIVCYTPAISFVIAAAVDINFSITGGQNRVFQAAWSFAFLLHSVNASITILLYYKTSSKYRQTLREFLPRCFSPRRET